MPQITLDRADLEKLHDLCERRGVKSWFLAKDDGAYVGANAGSQEAGDFEKIVFYFKGCDPSKNPDWWDECSYKFGGDDFGEHFDVEFLNKAVADPLTIKVVINVSQSSISMKSYTRKAPTPKPFTPKAAKAKKRGIGAIALEAIREGKNNDEVLDLIKVEFPEAKTTVACLNWYRNKLRNAA